MLKIAALIIGALIAIMIQMNGTLGQYTNVYFSSFFAHGLGAIGVFIITGFIKQNKNEDIDLPVYFYMGGAMGAIIIVLNNMSFQWLGVSMTVALILLGQVISSLLIDTRGLFNMEKINFNRKKILGFFLISFGILIMMFF